GQERRRHTRAALVEELDHGGVRPDGHDQLRLRLVGEEHGDVLTGALGHELEVVDAPLEEVLTSGGPPIGMHVVHQLGAAPEALLRHRVEVADDDVGLEAVLEERVGTAVDADEHRPVLADVRAQRGEVGAVVVPAHDDECVATGEVGPDGREGQRLEREPGLLLDVLERVLGEALQLGADGRARVLHRGLDAGDAEHRAAPEQLAVAPELTVLEADDVAFVHPVHQLDAHIVEQRDARAHDPDRTSVRVPAGDGLRAVHDRDDALLDQPVGGDAVEVAVVDDRDLARLQARDHVLGAPVDPRHSLDREGLGLLLEAQQAGHQRRPRRVGRARPDAPAVSSSSAAWRRAWEESPMPASMRDSSPTRASPSTVDADATVRSAGPAVAATTCSTVFSTTTWVPANAATCARCVTQRTWCREPSVCSRRPTATPASPPIPASTSSNTSVGGASDSTTRVASIARESSPPDAARASGRAVSPGLAASRYTTRS